MAGAAMPDEFFDAVAHHLPPGQPVPPQGGRPRIGHRIVMRVIRFAPATGNRWQDVPAELGGSGRAAHRRLRAWEEAGIWDRLHADLLAALERADELDADAVIVDGVTVRAFGGGGATGPSPVDRRRPGTTPTLVASKSGVPLAIRTAGADASDHRQVLPVVLDFPRVKGRPGRPKGPPNDLYAGRGYDSEGARASLRWLGIEPHIAKRGEPHGSGLGKVRRVVERTISWLKLKGMRRMRVRYDRLGVTQDAWTTLAACAIGFLILNYDNI